MPAASCHTSKLFKKVEGVEANSEHSWKWIASQPRGGVPDGMGRGGDDLIKWCVDLPLNERLKKRRTEVLKAGVVEWMRKQRVRNHRRRTEFICRLDGTAATRHRWCHGMVWHEREPRAKNSGAGRYIRKGG